MTRIAISGHRGLSPEVTEQVDRRIRSVLDAYDPAELVGLSCLADGADQIFARAVLDRGGELEAYVPAVQYREALPAEAHAEYDALIARAAKVHRFPQYVDSTAESHMNASTEMLQTADDLIAVWDGKPARSWGGTADVVAEARNLGLPVIAVWPEGATRD
jgi:hypothetical protein